MFRPSLLLNSTFLFFGLTSAALAAENAQKPVDEIITTGRYLSIDKLNAVKTPTPIINVPQSLSIIDDVQITRQGFTSISDITLYTPGLNNSQGEGHRDAIIIRGNQTTADFFQDGVRDDVQYFRPLYNLEQVEILRGANALLFGRGGVGGIINRVTKKPEIGEDFVSTLYSVDTFGAYSGAVDTNFTLSETSGLRVNGFYEGLNNHRDFFDGRRFGINPTIAVEVSPKTSLSLSYEYLDDDRVVDRGVPSQTTTSGPNVPLEGFDNTFFGSPDENFTTLQAHILRGRVDHAFTETLRGNFTAQYADYDKLYQNLYASDSVTLTNGSIGDVELDGYRDTTGRENLFLQGNLVGEFATGDLTHTVLFGAEYGSQDTENARLDNVFAQNNDDQISFAFTDPLNIPAFSFSASARDRVSDVTVFSAYVQDQIDLTEAFKVVLGARFDSFDIETVDIQAGNVAFERKDEEITPRLGLIYKPAENVSVYGSFSQTFVPRSGDQFLSLTVDTANTEPQFTENLEAGLKWDIRPNLSLTTAIFQLDRKSFTSVDPEDSSRLITVDGAKTEGFEVQLTGDLTDKWSVSTGYSYLNGRVEDVSDLNGSSVAGALDGNEPRQTPKHMVSLWNNYQLTESLGLGLGASYQDSYFVNEDNSVEVPSYIRFDAAAYYDVSDDIRLQVNIENLFDENYFPDAHNNNNITTGAPLNARFSLATKF